MKPIEIQGETPIEATDDQEKRTETRTHAVNGGLQVAEPFAVDNADERRRSVFP